MLDFHSLKVVWGRLDVLYRTLFVWVFVKGFICYKYVSSTHVDSFGASKKLKEKHFASASASRLLFCFNAIIIFLAI